MKNLSPSELQEWISDKKEFELVDVREEWEHEACNIGGRLIPLGNLMSDAGELPKEIPLVFYCEKGIRSVLAIQRLEQKGFSRLYNLSGGMSGWRKFIAGK